MGSKAVKMMRQKGILEAGYSETFAVCMQSCLRALMEHFHGCLGYTQSDEMVIFIAPTSIIRGERQQHLRSGRVTKTTTLAASFVTAKFVMQLCEECQKKGTNLDELLHVLPHFDCRMGTYSSWEEAQALLIWRAHDCSVNGVSDAVYQLPGTKHIMSQGTLGKIKWLWEQGKLPLPRHQAYGTILTRVKRLVKGYNPKFSIHVTSLRNVIEQVNGPVLELVRTDSLFLKDDVLET